MADRLLSTIGQDILDALFWTATEPRGRKREHLGTLPHLLLAIVYVSILSYNSFASLVEEKSLCGIVVKLLAF